MNLDLQNVNLLDLIGRDTTLKRVASTNGGEYAGPCPFCGGTDRLRVWPDHPDGKGRFWCRRCEKGGDAIDYVRERDGVGFGEAVELLGVTPVCVTRASKAPRPQAPVKKAKRSGPPGDDWQARGWDFVTECEAALWSGDHNEGLAWLAKRGLAEPTIKAARLGLNVQNQRDDRAAWGLEGDKPVWLPRGIVIPWIIEGDLWKVNIRRPAGDLGQDGAKYWAATGSCNGLYGADDLVNYAMIVEGELDALTIRQEAGDLVASVATGSTHGGRSVPWLARLAACEAVLVAYDTDLAGETASTWWLGKLDNARRWRPYWGDANEMAQDGVDLRGWILGAGLHKCRFCDGEITAYGPCGAPLCRDHAQRCEALGDPRHNAAPAGCRACVQQKATKRNRLDGVKTDQRPQKNTEKYRMEALL